MDPFNQLPCSLSLVWKEEKKGWKDWTLKSRLGNELLFTQGTEDVSVKGGWLFIKCPVCQWVIILSSKCHAGLVQWQCCSKYCF